MLLLDTHVLVWFATEDDVLGRRCRSLAHKALGAGQLAVSAISFWEIALLAAKGRLQISNPPLELRALLLDTGVLELPLAGDLAIFAAGLGLHGDSADRFIAATAISHGATLVTADERLLQWKHSLKRQDARR